MEAYIVTLTFLPALVAWLVISAAVRRLQKTGMKSLERELQEWLRPGE